MPHTLIKRSGLGIGIGILCLLVCKSMFRSEPAYEGKPLSAWAQQYGTNHWTGANRAADKEAELAIQKIGTNAIPFLLDLMRTKDSPLKKAIRPLVPTKWQAKLHLGDNSGAAPSWIIQIRASANR